MNKIKIRLFTAEETTEFVNICSKYDCDINVNDGRILLDAKSIISIYSVATGKIIEVQAITSNKSVISRFVEDMRKFEV